MPRTLASPRHEALRALLVERRKAAGLTQQRVASKLGRYQSYVAYLESGQRRIDVIEFLELSEAIGFDPFKLLRKLKHTKR